MEEKFVYKVPKDCAEKIETIAVKYIMPDDPKYIEDMVKEGWTITRNDEEMICYDWMVDGKSVFSKDYYKKTECYVNYDPNLVVNLLSLIKE